MKGLILRTLLLLFVVFLFIGCNSMCSDDKPKREDLIKVENLNTKFKSYKIKIDKCFPSGYFNVIVDDKNQLDTLLLDKIFYEVLDSKITAKEMQVMNEKGKLLYVQTNYNNPNTGESKPIRLKPEDL